MAEKQPVQADGDGGAPANDGVSEKPGGKSGSESSGAAYPNPHSGKDGDGFEGGQSDKTYRGPDNPNATTR